MKEELLTKDLSIKINFSEKKEFVILSNQKFARQESFDSHFLSMGEELSPELQEILGSYAIFQNEIFSVKLSCGELHSTKLWLHFPSSKHLSDQINVKYTI